MTMLQFANHILAVAYQNNLSINNLQLQKIMYFVMKEHEDNYELLKQIYDKPFYVWRYGPTVPKIYRKFRIYGASAIIEKGEKTNDYNIFDGTIIKLLKEDLFTLIDKSRKDKYWQENKDKIVNGTSNLKYKLNNILK